MDKVRKVCFVVASEMPAKAFLKEPIIALSTRYDVTLILNAPNTDFPGRGQIPATIIAVAIERPIRPLADLAALWRLYVLFRRHRFDVVHSLTPKAGLLAMLASRAAGTHRRVHTFTGQVWATRKGLSRQLLKSMDRILATCATHLLTDGHSQKQYLIEQRIVAADDIAVLAKGSISGVNTRRFRADEAARNNLRKTLGINEGDVLVLFLGRLNRDKGVLDLASAFANIGLRNRQLRLLFVGPDEGKMESNIRQMCEGLEDRINFVEYTDAPESYLAAADLLCLPSHREGFSTVVIEAAACGVPTIGSRIYGVVDTIVEGETGLLFPPGDVPALGAAIADLATQQEKRIKLGERALARARAEFSSSRVLDAWLAFYDSLSREGT